MQEAIVNTDVYNDNLYAEELNGRFRDEWVNTDWCMCLRHACDIIEAWRKDYNEVRPHSSLGNETTREYGGPAKGERDCSVHN